MMTIFLTRVFAVAAAVGLCACSSSHSNSSADSSGSSSTSSSRSKKDDSGTGKKMAQRLSIKEWNPKHRSQFEKQAQQAEKNKSVRTGPFHSTDFHTKLASTSETTDKKYHGKDFSQSDKKNNNFEKSFSGSHESNRMAAENYKTNESNIGDKKSHENGRQFNGGSQVFKTNNDVQAANAGEKAQLPKIIKSQKPSYTEDEVRAMLNKG